MSTTLWRMGAVLLLLGGPATAAADTALRDTGEALGIGEALGGIATLDDRYVAAVAPSARAGLVLDGVTWELLADDGGATQLGLCDVGDGSTRPNAVTGRSAADGSPIFYVACDDGILTEIAVNEATEGPGSLTLTSATLTLVDGSAAAVSLIDVSVDTYGNSLVILDADGGVHRTNLDIDAFTEEVAAVSLTGGGVPTSLATMVSTTLAYSAIGWSNGVVSIVTWSGTGTVTNVSCDELSVVDIVAHESNFAVALDSGTSDGVLALVDPTLPASGCSTVEVEGETVRRPTGLAVVVATSEVDLLYVAGESPSTGDAALVGIDPGEAWDGATVVTRVSPADDPGAIAAFTSASDAVFHAGATGGVIDLLSDAPFITGTATVVEAEADDGSDTPTPTPSTTTDAEAETGSITLQFESDEDGDYEVLLDGDSVLEGRVSAGSICCDDAIDTSTLGDGTYPLEVVVTDDAAHVGSRTFYVSMDAVPDAPASFAGGFGDASMILTWDSPDEDDVAYFDLIMFTAPVVDGAPAPDWDSAEAFLSANGASRTFSVDAEDGSTVTYPSSLGETTWPVRLSRADLDETPLAGITFTIEPLDNRTDADNGTAYYAAIRAVDATEHVSAWTDLVSAVPERVCGAACLAGDTGGLCAVAPPGSRRGDGLWAALILMLTATPMVRWRLPSLDRRSR